MKRKPLSPSPNCSTRTDIAAAVGVACRLNDNPVPNTVMQSKVSCDLSKVQYLLVFSLAEVKTPSFVDIPTPIGLEILTHAIPTLVIFSS
jgi:hypothetical protein